MSIYPRTEYEMTQDDLNKIIDACKPVPYIIIGGHPPPSQQENANRAWKELGERMGFDAMTVQPSRGGDRFFSAVPSETDEQRKARVDREAEAARLKRIAELEQEIADRKALLDTLTTPAP